MTKNRIYSNVNSSVSNISSKHDKIKIVNGGRQSINWNGMYKQRVKTNNDDDVDGHNEGYSSDFNSKSNSKSIHSICM